MITVIGDYIQDIYIYGEVTRISPEAPIPVFREMYKSIKHGGAGNVAENLKAFGNEVTLYTNKKEFSIKKRFVCNNHIMFRSDFDVKYKNHTTDFQTDRFVILSDYNKGYLHHSQIIIDKLIQKDKFVIVDPKKPLDNYKNACIIKCNRTEYNSYTGHNELANAKHIRKQHNIQSMLITLGKDGVYVSSDKFEGVIGTDNHQIADVTGAGDVFIASLTHFISKGMPIENACYKANKLASISVTNFGTYTLTKEDIKQSITVFTNGCFDVIHKGHIEYLRKSKELGSKLIVGLNSDSSIRRIKGNGRPVNNEKDRKAVLESLKYVDEVIIFENDTPYELIKQLKPDIITKGGDYTEDKVVGNDLAEVVIVDYIDGYSTTEFINGIKKPILS